MLPHQKYVTSSYGFLGNPPGAAQNFAQGDEMTKHQNHDNAHLGVSLKRVLKIAVRVRSLNLRLG